MGLSIQTSLGWRGVQPFVRTSTGWRSATPNVRHSDDAWHGGTSALSAAASPSTMAKFVVNGTPGPYTSGSTTVMPSGGTGPYTYAWTRLYGDPITINS